MERSAADINARLKSTEIVVKWIMAVLSALLVGGGELLLKFLDQFDLLHFESLQLDLF